MTNWQLSYFDTDWVDYYDISNPTNELEQTYNSNRVKYKLYNGTVARTITSQKFEYQDVSLSFDFIDSTNNLITNSNMTGTYSRTGTTITVTITSHGVTNGGKVNLDFTSGTYTTDGVYTATRINDNQFTIPCATGTDTNQNVTLIKGKSLRTLIDEGKRVRIKTHLSENSTRLVLEGYLTEVNKPWSLGLYLINGVSTTCFNLSCTLDIVLETWV